jgi:glycosyltransferase involved in cell wall biosynthesis
LIDGVIFGLQKAGGISKIWADLILELSYNKNLNITVLIPTNQNCEWERIKPKLERVTLVKRRRFRWGKGSLFLDSLYLTQIALRLKPDLWHQSYYVGYPFLYRGSKVSTLHDMITEVLGYVDHYDSRMKYKALKGAKSIISISRHTEKDLHLIWPEFKKKTTVVPNGTNFKKVEEVEKEPFFLFLGKRRGYKNFLPATRLLLDDGRLKEYNIIAIGGEIPTYEEKALGPRVTYLGILPQNEVEKWMSKSSLVLFPSLYEGFGMPIVEAFALGSPVLALNVSCISEVTGVEYPLAEMATLCDTAFQLLNEREKWVAYGEKRKDLFTVEKMAENMLDFYQSCVSPSSPSHSMQRSI